MRSIEMSAFLAQHRNANNGTCQIFLGRNRTDVNPSPVDAYRHHLLAQLSRFLRAPSKPGITDWYPREDVRLSQHLPPRSSLHLVIVPPADPRA